MKNRIVATSIVVVWDVRQKPVLPEAISVVNKINYKIVHSAILKEFLMEKSNDGCLP